MFSRRIPGYVHSIASTTFARGERKSMRTERSAAVRTTSFGRKRFPT
jgi:hypothetical protein